MLRIRKKTLLIIGILAAVVIFKPSILERAKIFIFELSVCPIKAVRSVRESFHTRGRLIKENFQLKEKAAVMALEIARNAVIQKENDRLNAILEFKKRLPFKSIAARVIGRLPSSWTNSIFINKGETNGVKERMTVATQAGLVGTVVETGPFSSKIMLITDPNSRVGVMLDRSRQMGVLIGMPNGDCRVIYLGMDSNVQQGEIIFTSDIGGFFPEGVQVGTVSRIGIDKVGLYKYADVKTYQNLNSLEEVICIE